VGGRKAELVGRLKKHDKEDGEEDEEEDEGEESDEETDSDEPKRHYCDANHSRGRCRRPVKAASVRCNSHQPSPKRARAPKRSARQTPSPRTPSPKRQAFEPSTTSLKDLARMGEVKDVLAEFKAMMNIFTPNTGAVAAVPSHEKYMEIIRAVTSNGQSRAPEPEVVRVHTVDSVLSTVGCFKHKQAVLAEGVVEAEDLYALASKDKLLDKIGLAEVEKDRYKRKMRDVYGA
jgi:hypothetical protein